MKQIVLTLAFVLFGAPLFAADVQKVCTEQTDQKTKKTRQVCKEIKVHKKLEGTAVPEKKAK